MSETKRVPTWGEFRSTKDAIDALRPALFVDRIRELATDASDADDLERKKAGFA